MLLSVVISKKKLFMYKMAVGLFIAQSLVVWGITWCAVTGLISVVGVPVMVLLLLSGLMLSINMVPIIVGMKIQ